MSTNAEYGSDVRMFVGGSGPPDLDPYFTSIDGPEAVAQNVALRCYTPKADVPGYLIGSENDGIFLPDFMNAPMAKSTLFQIKAQVTGEAIKDERVDSGSVAVDATLDLATQTMTVDISGDTDEGPFEFVLSVSDVTVELLKQS